MGCTVERLVNEHVVSVEGGETVQRGVALMAENGAGAVVVTDATAVVGLFTERDLLNRVVAQGLDAETVTLAEVCSRDLVAIEYDYSCEAAARKMEINGCRRMLVNRNGRFIGMVTLQAVAHELARSGVGRNRFADLFVGLTVAASIVIVALLLYQLPAMMRVAERIG
ncbi:MAG: CBS domain-containing protein [Chromatiales bacterium]|nr:CBS domain-containing protein [Chromatiales bacterium]